jgi:hypothetical protein
MAFYNSPGHQHAHHIVMRNGPPIGLAQDDVKESKEILKRALKGKLKDDNPDHAWQNLVWAPNYGGGNHTGNYAAAVRYNLQNAEENGTVLDTLKELGGEFNRGNKFNVGPWTAITPNWRT